MFHSARIKLTAWYVAIIMFISIFFSLVIYAGIHTELHRFERFQQMRIEREQEGFPLPTFRGRSPVFDLDMIVAARNRLIFILIFINLGILAVSSAAAYFLAGQTLAPIAGMVDEQNRFIADSSHEFRTPLTSLRSEIEVNLRDKNLSLSEAKKLLKSNLEEVVNLQSLSNNLMELASYQNKNSPLLFEKLLLTKVITSACKKIAPLARQKNIYIKTKHTDYMAWGNEQSLIELFVILLDNAVKYSPKNKGIHITSDKKNHTLSIRMKDEGQGISPHDIPHLFDRFYRADKSRSKEKVMGYGLGLSIAKKIVDMHNGSVSVESRLNRGTTIVIKLPMKR